MRKLAFFLVLSVPLLILSFPSRSSWAFWDLWTNQQGVQAYQNKDYATALKRFERFKEGDPQPKYHYNLGNTYFRLNQFQEAEKEYLQSLNASDEAIRLKSLYNLGNVKFRQKDLKSALGYYEKALKIDPDYKEAKLNRDFVLKQMEKERQEQQNKSDDSSSQDKQAQPNQADQESGSTDKQGSPDQQKSSDEQKNSGAANENSLQEEPSTPKATEEKSNDPSQNSSGGNPSPDQNQKEAADARPDATNDTGHNTAKLPDSQIYRILESLEDNPGKSLKQTLPGEEKASRRKIEKPW